MKLAITPNHLTKALSLTKTWVVKQSPILLTVAGVGGVITTTIMTVRATTEAERLIEQKKYEKNLSVGEKLTIQETVQTAWKPFIPVAISMGFTLAAIIGSSAINEKRKAALAGLYAISETALKEYQEKTEEIAGKNVAQKIRDGVNADKVKDEDSPFEEQVLLGEGKCLVKDLMSGRYFRSSMQEINHARDEINDCIMSGDMCASLNDYYEVLGLDPIELGYEVGWKIGHICRPYCTSCLTRDGVPVLVLDWDPKGRPEADYRDI